MLVGQWKKSMPKLARLFVCLPLLIAGFVKAEPAKIPHGSVELVSSVQWVRPGASFQIGLLFRLEPGWHIYWKNPGDSGQPPRLTWQLPAGFTAGEIEWPLPKRLPVGPLLDYGYEGEVLLPLTVEATPDVKPNSTEELSANLRMLVCRETCIPGKAALALKVPVRKATPAINRETEQLFARARAAQPKALPADWKVSAQQSKSSIVLSIAGAPPARTASFIPAQAKVIDNPAPQNFSTVQNGIALTLKRPSDSADAPSKLEGLLFVEQGGSSAAYVLTTPVTAMAALSQSGAAGSSPQSLFTILALAFGGGLILNLMPCVFPVLSIKVLGLLDHAQGERRTIRLSAALYTAGVLASFWVLVAVLLVLRSAGRSLGWGFQLQSPGFVAFLICLLFVLGLSLIGAVEIGSSLMSTGGSLTRRGRYSSSFFTGVLATVVATPCTAPLMGAAVGFALGQSPAICALVFTVMAIGLASPFLLLSLFPGLSRFLPRPGAWMETLKQALAFPVFATVIWLLWVLGQQAGVNQLAVMLFALLILSVATWIASRWSQSRAATALSIVLGLAVTVYCAATLKPVEASSFASKGGSEGRASGGLKWEPFSPAKLASYRASGKPVLIDFTAAWCLTCQVNDRVVFHAAEVENRLNHSDIALLRADWTSYDPMITEWLAKFGRSGIPFYVLYGAEQNASPITLPDGILTPSTFLQNLSKVKL